MGKLEPQPLSYVDAAPFTVTASYLSPTPAATAFEVLKDNPGGVNWMGSFVTKVRSTSDPEHGVGATREVTFLWGLGKLKERFVGWEEPSLWSFTAVGFRPKVFSRFVERVRIEPVDDASSRIHYSMGSELSPLFKPLAPLIRRWFDGAALTTLRGLSEQAVKRTS
ncbi:SRPBCC family protein [Streptomyces sp. NPDC091377]|uniref:SRPBCC family protein n=1 Tax=Streptomyces sp. NPDC091377 TaxID=3365995 RepID=UPI003821256A